MAKECEKAEQGSENILRTRRGQIRIPKEASEVLAQKHFGDDKGRLSPIEVLYLLERRNFKLMDSDREIGFGEYLRQQIAHDPEMLPRYIVYRDWRDRGVFPFEVGRAPPGGPRPVDSGQTRYPTEALPLPDIRDVSCYFFRGAEMSMIHDQEVAEQLYYEVWLGQLGKYKQERAGTNLSLDLIETIYLLKEKRDRVRLVDAANEEDMTFEELLSFASGRHPGIEDLISVYEDWRRSGYIVKTGFKFGAHFRIYFPGAGTGRDKWVHSKHVLHVFPKSYRMLMSEWGRIIRLSQSVRKTFILGVPALSKDDYDDQERADLVLYHRTKDGIQDPDRDPPTFLCVAIPETLRMSGLELASALREGEGRGLQLLMAVVDRETDINYYVARKISLRGAQNSYYEIYWYRP